LPPGLNAMPRPPDLASDREALARIAAGNLKSLVGYDAAELDAAGDVELRCWACAVGALGDRKPDIVSLEPSGTIIMLRSAGSARWRRGPSHTTRPSNPNSSN
jgi:hypothetical protein